MSRFRTSKYRNATSKNAKRDEWFTELCVGNLSGEGNHVKASCKYIAFNWESAGGGSLGIVPVGAPGKFARNAPQVHAHSSFVSDFDFSPFDDQLLATGSDDQTLKIWKLPDEMTGNVSDAAATLSGHAKRIDVVQWHPCAADTVAASFADTVNVWNVNVVAAPAFTLSNGGAVWSMCWSGNGQYLATTSKDKKARVWDVRSGDKISEGDCHGGTKATRIVWLGDDERFMTTGYSSFREREYAMWDMRNLGSAVARKSVDSSTGSIIPLYDPDTCMVLLAGKVISLRHVRRP